LAYVAACVVASGILLVPTHELLTSERMTLQGALTDIFWLSITTTAFAALPASVIIMNAEFSNKITLMHYLRTGALTGAVIGGFVEFLILLMSISTPPTLFTLLASVELLAMLAAFVVAGVGGGLIYWLLAGRFAGMWRNSYE